MNSDWGSGMVATVTIRNSAATAMTGWALAFTFPGNQKITNLWNGALTQTGTAVTVRDAGYNRTIGAGATVSFGFQTSYSGTNASPARFTLNGGTCVAA